MGNNIIISGQEFDIGTKVVLWNEKPYYNFYNTGKLKIRNLSIDQLRQKLNMIVIHHADTYRASTTFAVLKERGLSCNFLIDDDENEDGCATIYQCADIKDSCYSQKIYNDFGPGIEVSYRPGAWQNTQLYSVVNQNKYKVKPHDIVTDKIHGHTLKVFSPSKAQVKSLIFLVSGYLKAFPDIVKEFPKDENGNYIKTIVNEPRGIVNHFNLDRAKIDAIGLDLEYLEKEIKKKVDGKPFYNFRDMFHRLFVKSLRK